MTLVTDKQFYMHKTLVENLDILIKAVNKKWDGVIIIDGLEGSGKTTLAKSCGYYFAHKCGTNFNLDHIVFLPEQFMWACANFKPKSVIVWDEFIFGGYSSDAINTINKTITKMLTIIRNKQLFIILVIPWIFMLTPYVAVARSRCLLNVYTPDGISRGSFSFYSYSRKRTLYFKNKRWYSYYGVDMNFRGDFRNMDGMLYDEAEYEKKKEEASKSLTITSSVDRAVLWKKRVEQDIVFKHDILNWNFNKIGEYYGLDSGYIGKTYKQTKDKEGIGVK